MWLDIHSGFKNGNYIMCILPEVKKGGKKSEFFEEKNYSQLPSGLFIFLKNKLQNILAFFRERKTARLPEIAHFSRFF